MAGRTVGQHTQQRNMSIHPVKKPIILIGGGGHCLAAIDVIELDGQYEIRGILDLPEKVGSTIQDYPVIGTDEDIEELVKECRDFHITVGQIKSSAIRERIFKRVKKAGGRLPVIISPLAYVSPNAQVGEGSIVMHQAMVNAGATVGNVSIVNSKALIEHEATIGDFCHISTGAVINGQAHIGDRCFIGSNAVVSNNVRITENTLVAAGAQVLKNISIPGTYGINPLRKIR